MSAAGDGVGSAPAVAARDPAGLTFLDLLYAIPLADLATKVSGTGLKGIPAEGWTEIALVMAVITFGWVGHHNNRHRESERQPAGDFPFLSLRFFQFLVEVLIIVAYFALADHVTLHAAEGHHHASANWQFAWLVVIFVLYLLWDILDVINGKNDWKIRACKGLKVTAVTLVVLIVVALVVDAIDLQSAASIAIADCFAIVLMYAFRAIQEHVTSTP